MIRRSKEELLYYPEILLFYRHHEVLAVRDLLGINLAPHQRIDLRLMWRSNASNIFRVFGRGLSKTFDLSVYLLLRAMLYSGSKLLPLGGGGFRQGKIILNEIERIIKGELNGQSSNGFALNMIDIGNKKSFSNLIHKDPDMWYIKLTNGSQIATAPIGQKGDAIRGFRAHVSAVDERKEMSKEIKQKIVKPFSIIGQSVVTDDNVPDNVHIDSGTIEYEEDDYTQEYYEALRRVYDGDKSYAVIKFVYADAFQVAYDDNYKYDSKYFLHKMKQWKTRYNILVDKIEDDLENATTDIESWRSEYLCEPMRATGDFYSFNIIKNASKKKIYTDEEYFQMETDDDVFQFLAPQKEFYSDPCILGIDVARENDLTAFVIIRLGAHAVGDFDKRMQSGHTEYNNIIWAYQEPNMHDPEVAIKIYNILEKFNIVRIAMDKRGGGTGVRDQLYHVVKDGKVNANIIYDPEDDGNNGIATLMHGQDGSPILRLLTYSDEDNTKVNRAIRTAMENGRLFFSGGDELRDDGLKDIQYYINTIQKQFKMIKTKPTKNWQHFYTENPKKYHKDLYSATIYAYGEVLNMDHALPEKKPVSISTIAPILDFKLRK